MFKLEARKVAKTEIVDSVLIKITGPMNNVAVQIAGSGTMTFQKLSSGEKLIDGLVKRTHHSKSSFHALSLLHVKVVTLFVPY